MQLREFIRQVYPMSDASLDEFSASWEEVNFKRKTVLTAEGETESWLYFVKEGIQRAYAIDSEGREATIVFTYPPSFSGVADSLLTKTPSRYFFETLTSSRLDRIPASRLFEMMDTNPEILKWVMRATAFTLQGVLQRQAELQVLSAEQRIKTVWNRSPHLFQLVPHKYIASYVGVDATNFSKMFGRIGE